MSQPYYPPLSLLLPLDRIPPNLGVIGDALTGVFDRVFYRNLHSDVTRSGDSGYYKFDLVFYHSVGIEIPGTNGLALLLNPASDASGNTYIPVEAQYSWPILKYIRGFKPDSFADSARSFFDLVLDVIGATEEELLAEVIAVFIEDPDPITKFIADFNTKYGVLLSGQPPTGLTVYEFLIQQIGNVQQSLGLLEVIFNDYVAVGVDFDAIFERLKALAQRWLGEITVDDLRRLLVPEASVALTTLTVGLQFPTSVLRAVDKDGNPLPGPNGGDKPSLVTVDVASLTYSTKSGLDFDIQDNLTINFPRSEILRSGLFLDVHELKVDFSRTSNIPEATADGRPVDFVGVYIKDGSISFPAFWSQEKNTTGTIKVRNLLLGTGGVSGTLSLEASDKTSTAKPVVKFKFGEKFSLSLDKFSITLKQNAFLGSVVEGTLVVPGFLDANKQPAEIRVKVDIRADGDFDATLHEADGFKPIQVAGVFELTLESAFFGKKDDDFYLGVSGSIRFTHEILKNIIKEPIKIEKLVIWSNGRFEIEGGTIPLPENVRFPIGPAELSISAIHLGSHERKRPDGSTIDFRYFGFDAAVDINPGGVDVRGKGIKFYYPINDDLSLSYLEIKSLAIDLVIPGSASRDAATLLISGFLSVEGSSGDPEYAGGISFALPRAQIAGGAAMKYRPRTPAFFIDAFVELSVPLPLAATSLGFYGFQGRFGMRYIATKSAAGLVESDSWFDYYKKVIPPFKEGLNILKFEPPGQTEGYDSTYSIGAGASIATVSDSGKALSMKLFLLLSLPDLIYLEGKANIVGERIGLDSQEDPPFFAMLAISRESVELGAGVHYTLPRDGGQAGWILDLNAEMRAAFFFKNRSAWFVNVGTIEKPTTARVLSLFDATSYLMLSASGIAAGAGVTFGFNKSYAGGVVRASVGVYIKVGGFISFERPQIGGFAMLGGHVDVSLMWFSFYIILDTSLAVEVPKPFYITGKVHLCVGVTIGFWKFKKTIEKCFDVEFRWEKNPQVDTTPVLPFSDVTQADALQPASATNMLSGETFPVVYLSTSAPSDGDPRFDKAVLPLDTWVDLEFLKGLMPTPAVDARIGRMSGQAPGNIEYIPPAQAAHKVKHEYSISAVEVMAWNGTQWVDYRPYQAMSPPDALTALAANPTAYKDGFWANTGGGGFNKIRLLAETSLTYMQQGQPGWYVPEQMGISSTTLFCREELRGEHCIDWRKVPPGTAYPDGTWQQVHTALYRIVHGSGTAIQWIGPAGVEHPLAFPNEATAEIVFNEPCAEVRLKLTTFATDVLIRLYKRETIPNSTAITYKLVESRTLTQLQLLAPVLYQKPDEPVAKVEILPAHPDPSVIYALEVQLDGLYRSLHENPAVAGLLKPQITTLETKLQEQRARTCTPKGTGAGPVRDWIKELKLESRRCQKDLAGLQAQQNQACEEASALQSSFEHCFPSPPGSMPCVGPPHLDCWRDVRITVEIEGRPVVVSARDVYCRQFEALYTKVYEEALQQVQAATRRCDELTAELETKTAECEALAAQLEAAQELLTFIEQHGPLQPPDAMPCFTLLHEVCWLTLEDHEFNVTIPAQAAIVQDYAVAVDAIQSMLTPMWRPDTKYTVRLEVRDTVNDSAQQPPEQFYFGFRTAGPVGYFHTDPAVTYVETGKSPDQYVLTSLKGYIDYRRSYPNADGELIRAKPLFYEDARILLFFTKRYVYHFFGSWPAYNGLPALTDNRMEIVIKDPAQRPSAPKPAAETEWTLDEHPRIGEDIRTLSHLRNPRLLNDQFSGAACWPLSTDPAEVITPASVYTRSEPEHLRPLKLYTAIVNNVYRNETREVHRYVLQTSRYPHFKAQVNSYHLDDGKGNSLDAIFQVKIPLAASDIALMYDIVTGNPSAANQALAGIWADPFDRLIEGVFKRPPLDAAVSTEFNIVRNANTGGVVAVWIRNPEPFNDPKLPDEVLERSLRVMQELSPDLAYKVLFSKDRSQAFVMHPSQTIPLTQLRFRFAYIEWDGVAYVDHAVVITGLIPTNP
jgi:hypothetical protein